MLAASFALVLLTGCGGGPDSDGTTATAATIDPDLGAGSVEGTILVFAAASLTDAFADIERAFETEYPASDVQLNLAGSSGLREQILEGAPADVFASADQSNMAQVAAGEGTAAPPRVFVRNRLQIAVPAGNPAGITGLEDFARSELLIGLCAEDVPCGRFARESLALAGVEPSLDTNEPDVRALLTKLGAGELDAGITYVTDVRSGNELVDGLDIPSALNVVADYPIASLASAPNPRGAAAFVSFVLDERGQSILAGYGFDIG